MINNNKSIRSLALCIAHYGVCRLRTSGTPWPAISNIMFTTKLTLPLRVCINQALASVKRAPAILAAAAVYCIHGRSRGRQTVQNVSEKHALSPSASTANMHQLSHNYPLFLFCIPQLKKFHILADCETTVCSHCTTQL